MTKFRLAVIIGLALALLTAFASDIYSFAKDCTELREDVFRLHVIANSDSPEDQAIKLNVRDLILGTAGESVSGAADKAEVVEYFTNNAQTVEAAVNEYLSASDCGYRAEVSVARSYFDTRVYDGNTLPSGEYDALKIVLGNGEGKNWWCVMFPPLCISAADGDELSEDEYKLMESGGTTKYKIKLKVVEWFRSIKARFDRPSDNGDSSSDHVSSSSEH